MNHYPISCLWYKGATFNSLNCINTHKTSTKIAWYMQYENVLKVSLCLLRFENLQIWNWRKEISSYLCSQAITWKVFTRQGRKFVAGFGNDSSYPRFLGPVPQLLPSAGSEGGGCLGFLFFVWGFLFVYMIQQLKNTTGKFTQCSLCKPTVLRFSSTNT